jgi:hypothetical protein
VAPHLRKRTFAHKAWRVHLLLIAGEVILAAAVIRWIRSGHTVVFRIEVEKGSLWWTQFPWYAAAAAFAGAIALITFLSTRAQNQQHFERQQAAEQERFDRQELDSLFIDIQNRFASESAMVRANAAIRLAEMAEMRLPGKPAAQARENYPFFSRAASQLSAALHMEREQAVRDEVMKALDRMTGFARRGNQALLSILIAELADANRSAKKSFVDVLAKYCSLYQEITDDDLRLLTGFAPFCLAPNTAVAGLRDLASSKRCRDAASVQSALRAAQWAGTAAICEQEERLRLLPEIQSSAARLIDTRTSLVIALHARCPQNVASRLTGLAEGEPDPQARLDLQETQLQGADLHGALLPGAFLDGAHLQGAILAGAQLPGAQLHGANLTDADLTDANLQDARYDGRTQWPAAFDPQQHGALLGP